MRAITAVIITAWLLYIGFATHDVMAADSAESMVKQVVNDAILLYGTEGGGAFDTITSGGLQTPDGLYAFVTNATSWTRVADGIEPGNVGRAEGMLDTSAKSVDLVLAELEAYGETWIRHISYHKGTGTDQVQHTFLRLHDGLVFGAGYYILDAHVQNLVRLHTQEYDNYTQSAAFAVLGTIPAETISTYVFVVDPATGVVKAQNVNADLIHMSDWDAIVSIVSPLELAFMLVDRPGVWVSYTFTNPITGEMESKRTWLTIHDGLVFGSGYYSLDVPVSEVRFVVDNAIQVYEQNKENDAWVGIITPEENKRSEDLYPFIFNATTFRTVAHGSVPDRIGHVPYSILNTGDRPLELIQSDLESNGETWTLYSFRHPPTGTVQLKYAYMKLHEGHIFASGWYVLDSQVQSINHNLILEYINKGPDAAFRGLEGMVVEETPDYVFEFDTETGYASSTLFSGGLTPTYTFVVDPTVDIIKAQRAGTDTIDVSEWGVIKSASPTKDLVDTLSGRVGLWITYSITDADDIKDKRVWLTLHDGLIFGSGYILPLCYEPINGIADHYCD